MMGMSAGGRPDPSKNVPSGWKNALNNLAAELLVSSSKTITPLSASEKVEQKREIVKAQKEKTEVENIRRVTYRENKIKFLHHASVAELSVSGGAFVLGGADLVWAGTPGIMFGWWLLSAVSGLLGVLSLKNKKKALDKPVSLLALPVVPPPLLEPNMIGKEEAANLLDAEASLYMLLPGVKTLQTEAGMSLEDVADKIRPVLYSLIERLFLVNKILSGSFSSGVSQQVALEAAESLRTQLAHGVVAYRELVIAAVKLVGSPGEFDVSIQKDILDATHDLEAYAVGLSAAGKAFDAIYRNG